MTRPEQRPEGALIQRALDRLDLSAKEAARRIDGISDTRLRQIVSGYEPLGEGRRRPVVAKAGVLARIAHTLEITPEELEQADRSDAAGVLRDRLRAPQKVAEVPDVDIRAQLDWVRQQDWSAAAKQEVAGWLIEIDQQAQRERRAG